MKSSSDRDNNNCHRHPVIQMIVYVYYNWSPAKYINLNIIEWSPFCCSYYYDNNRPGDFAKATSRSSFHYNKPSIYTRLTTNVTCDPQDCHKIVVEE
jgi:hypothetical protein